MSVGVSCLFPTAWTLGPKYLGECLSLLSSFSRDIYSSVRFLSVVSHSLVNKFVQYP